MQRAHALRIGREARKLHAGSNKPRICSKVSVRKDTAEIVLNSYVTENLSHSILSMSDIPHFQVRIKTAAEHSVCRLRRLSLKQHKELVQ